MSEQDDKTFFQLLDQGSDDAAFKGLVQSHQERLYQLCRRVTGSHEDAHDAMQESFIKAWKSIGKFNRTSTLHTWLYRIAYNTCLDQLKRKRIHSIDISEAHQLTASSDGYNAAEIEAKLDQALATLPDKQRLVFCMKYYDEKKYTEIAEITGTSIGALKSSYHIAVKKIEAHLKQGSNLLNNQASK